MSPRCRCRRQRPYSSYDQSHPYSMSCNISISETELGEGCRFDACETSLYPNLVLVQEFAASVVQTQEANCKMLAEPITIHNDSISCTTFRRNITQWDCGSLPPPSDMKRVQRFTSEPDHCTRGPGMKYYDSPSFPREADSIEHPRGRLYPKLEEDDDVYPVRHNADHWSDSGSVSTFPLCSSRTTKIEPKFADWYPFPSMDPAMNHDKESRRARSPKFKEKTVGSSLRQKSDVIDPMLFLKSQHKVIDDSLTYPERTKNTLKFKPFKILNEDESLGNLTKVSIKRTDGIKVVKSDGESSYEGKLNPKKFSIAKGEGLSKGVLKNSILAMKGVNKVLSRPEDNELKSENFLNRSPRSLRSGNPKNTEKNDIETTETYSRTGSDNRFIHCLGCTRILETSNRATIVCCPVCRVATPLHEVSK